MSADDTRFMRIALREARRGLGRTSPNPAVGAVIVTAGKIVAKGHHRAAGLPHAEIECLQCLIRLPAKGDTLYVTLEPCSTQGRTPPCTEAIIAAGITTVVIGSIDLNPSHRGRGIAALRAAGITVRTGILADECGSMNAAFNKWIKTKRPFVIAKCGMSLDGRLTRPPGEKQWLTSAAARRHANALRGQVDAILVGAETVRADNPRLTVRGTPGVPQPWRVILTRSGRIPPESHVLSDRFADRTILFPDKPLDSVLEELGARSVTSVLIEGGGAVLGQALDGNLIDEVQIYLAPLFTGGAVVAFPGRGAASSLQGVRLQDVRYDRIGADIYLSGKATYPGANSE